MAAVAAIGLDAPVRRRYHRPMSIDKVSILRFLRDQAHRPMKTKELAKALNVPPSDYAEFRATIKELIDTGELVRLKRNRVGVASEMNILVDTISMTRNGLGFVAREEGEDVMIPASQTHTALDGDKVMVRLTGTQHDRQIGTVVRVLERSERNIVGVFRRGRDFSFVVPDSPRFPRDIYVPDRATAGAEDGEKVVLKLTVWDDPHLNPQGRVTERLGYPGDPGVDMLTVIKSFDLPEAFPDEVAQEAERLAVMPSRAEQKRRENLTDQVVYTIDPTDAKDYDDAISVEKTRDGYRLSVHIADVSHFVPHGSLVDKEAFERGNSVYLPGMVVPMIPEVLSNDLCSLKPNRLRLAHSCIMEFNRRGRMTDWRLTDSLIKSRSRLAYEEVQALFDGRAVDDRVKRVADNLRLARELARILSERRFAKGSLDFDLPEAKVIMNAKGEVLELGSRVRLEAHRLVEEFMLAANKAVALEVFRKGQPMLYRVHARPDMEKLNAFAYMMERLGLHFAVSVDLKPIHFARFLKQIQDRPDADFINEIMLRSMQKAVYQAENIGHFGLAFTHYTHFTSPIRRYPDLLVHRLVRKLRGRQKYPAEFGKRVPVVIKHVGEHCSETERKAERAEREAIKVKQVAYMAKHIGDEYSGVISGVTGFGFFVRLDNLGAEGLVRLTTLDDDYYIHEEAHYRLVGRRTGRIFRLGDPIRVGVLSVDQVKHEVDLFVAETEAAKKRPAGPKRKQKKPAAKPGKAPGKKPARKQRKKRR